MTVDGVANLNQTTAQYLNAVNITSTGEVNAVSIKANGLRSDDIQTTENKKYLTELDVDNQTIQVVNGKLHANLDELGNEVNDLAGRVTGCESDILTMKTSIGMKQTKLTAGANITLTNLTDGTVRIDATGGGGTGDVPIATTTTAGKVKPDGTTITITDDGTISAVGGGGSVPTNMVTTDTDQTITGIKTFTPSDTPSYGVKTGLAVGSMRLGYDTSSSSNPVISGENVSIVNSSGTPIATFGSAENISFGNGSASMNLKCLANTINIKAGASINYMGNLQVGVRTLTYTSATGETTDLLAGNIPTVIDGGDSTTA